MKHLTGFFIAIILFMLVPNFVYAATPGLPKDYRVGVDYHTTTASMDGDFLGVYDDPQVRSNVLTQLQGMADSGAKVISTRIWLARAGNPPTFYGRNFPLTSQELENIRQYTIDASSIKGKDGNYMDLYLGFLYLGCGNYHLETCGTFDQYFVPNAKKTYDDFFAAVGPLTRPDGKKAVTIAYADGEVIINGIQNGKPNTDKFLTQVYPYFIADANKYGITPSLYFLIQNPETQVLNNIYTNPAYPAINGHWSLQYIYPTTEFMRQNGIPIPKRLDMSVYIDPVTQSYQILINRVYDDLLAIYPNNDFGVAETQFFTDLNLRKQLGQAYATNFLARGEPKVVTFWTTPGFQAVDSAAYPFDISGFLVQTNPIGFIQTPTCSQIPGWAGDQDLPNTSIEVHFYANGPAGGGGTFIGSTFANVVREQAVCDAIGSKQVPCPHGYVFTTPESVKDNKPHTIFAYGINAPGSGGINSLLTMSPLTLPACAPTPLLGDLNNDKHVDLADYNLIKTNFVSHPYTIFDYNNLITNFGK